MKNSWNLFWKDYANLAFASIDFCRHHWFGMFLITIMTCMSFVVMMISYVNGGFDNLRCWISQKWLRVKDSVAGVIGRSKQKTK